MTNPFTTLAIASVALLAASASFAAPVGVGEFSAADTVVESTAAPLSRAAVRDAVRGTPFQASIVNGEIIELPETRQATTATRAEVRQEGRLAARAHTMPAGELSM